jgi:hypothetical protein
MTASFVVGQWVRGARFYGRCSLRAAILEGEHPRSWIAGLRRVGKTSLLRQLELELTARGAVVLFLDLQGLESPADLARGLADAWLDGPAALTGSPFFGETAAFDRLDACLDGLASTASSPAPFWLLIDEGDEVAAAEARRSGLAAAVGSLVERVSAERASESPRRGHVVLASSLRLADRVAAMRTADDLRWLDAFEAPRWLGALARGEAEALLRQRQAPPESRSGFDDGAVTAIADAAADHPMIVQMLAKRALECGSVEDAVARLAGERTLEHLFAVDFALLGEGERRALRSAGGPSGAPKEHVPVRLVDLGLVAEAEPGRASVRSPLLRDWLCRGEPLGP